MILAPKSIHEAERLQALNAYQIFGSGAEPAFDRITSLAAQVLDTPMAFMSLIGEESQWIKSSHGTSDIQETPLDVSFCAHTILTEDVMVVPDAACDPRFSDNPLVLGEPGIRFYAGCPLRTPSGHNIGTLCVVDRQPRTITPEMKVALGNLSHLVVDQLEFRDRLIGEATDQKREAETNYRRLAEALPGMVFRGKKTKADNFEYVYVGPGSVDLFGVSPSALLEERFRLSSQIHPDDLQSFLDASTSTWESLSPWNWVGRVSTIHGELRWVHIVARSEGKADGTLINEGIMYDVTESKRREVALSKAKDAAERASHAKSEFLSRMSHELRTPMNAILGFAQVLEMTILEGPGQRDVFQIKKAGEHLLGLINEVLDLSAVDANSISFSIEPVRLGNVLEETASLLRPLFEMNGVLSPILPTEDVWVLADRHRLKQIAINIMTNAVKYNRKNGSVILKVTRVSDSATFSITDDGEGIAPERIKRLFTPFDRLGAEVRGIEGTGLGLAISRGLVEQMGGSLSVSSILGQGSTFTVTLPQVDDPMVTLPDMPEEPFPLVSDPPPRQILYVEDNESNVALVERILEQRAQTRLTIVPTIADALACLSRELPDVLLLDLNLPDGSGETVLNWVRTESSDPDLPVIVLSADATPRQAERIIGAGADHYLTKPLQVPALLRVLDNALKGARS